MDFQFSKYMNFLALDFREYTHFLGFSGIKLVLGFMRISWFHRFPVTYTTCCFTVHTHTQARTHTHTHTRTHTHMYIYILGIYTLQTNKLSCVKLYRILVKMLKFVGLYSPRMPLLNLKQDLAN